MSLTAEEKIKIKKILAKYKKGDQLWSKADMDYISVMITMHQEDFYALRPDYAAQVHYFLDSLSGKDRKPDYSHLCNIPAIWSSFHASKSFYGNRKVLFENPDSEKILLRQKNLFNPFLRHGIELASRAQPGKDITEEQIGFCKNIDSKMNEKILINTLTPAPEKNGPKDSATRKLQTQNIYASATLAKSLLLAHLGGFYVVESKGKRRTNPSHPYTGTMGDTLAHGGRLLFIWGKKNGEASDSMANAFLGEGEERAAFKRKAGTHDVDVIEKKGALNDITELQGLKHASFHDNYGMNLAVGGFGEANPGAGTILNDGKNGHMFAHILESKDNKNGLMLMGIEGSAPSKRDFTGNKHDFRGLSSPFSPFMADKLGGVGPKLGGRRIDLTMYNEEELKETLKRFGEYYTDLHRKALAGDKEGTKKLKELNKKLSGKHMSVETLTDILSEVSKSQALTRGYNPCNIVKSLKKRDSLSVVHFGMMDNDFQEKRNLSPKTLYERIQASQKDIFGQGSDEFFQMQTDFARFADSLAHAPAKDASKEETDTYTDLMAIRARNLVFSAEAYLQKKNKESKIESKTQTRMDIAKDLITFAADYGMGYQNMMDQIKTVPDAKREDPKPIPMALPNGADLRSKTNAAYSKALRHYKNSADSLKTKLANVKAIFSYSKNNLSKEDTKCMAMYVYSGIASSILENKDLEKMHKLSVSELLSSIAKAVEPSCDFGKLTPMRAHMLMHDRTFLNNIQNQVKAAPVKAAALVY